MSLRALKDCSYRRIRNRRRVVTSRGPWGLRVEYRACGPSASSSGGSANLTTLGVCATPSPSHPPCKTPLSGGFLADISLLHPPKCTPQTIDNNASWPPVSGGGPGLRPGPAPRVPPSLGAAPCPSVRGRHRPPVRRQPRPPTRHRGGARGHPSGGDPRVSTSAGGGPGFPSPGGPRVPPSRGSPAIPLVRWRPSAPPSRGLTPGFPHRARPAHTVPFPPWASVPGTTVGPPPRDYPCPHVPRSPVPRLSEGGGRWRTGLLGTICKTLPTRSESPSLAW